MIEQVKEIVKNACTDDFDWDHHITLVVKHALELADRLQADKEIVEIAAWLHDIGRLQGGGEDHHITGEQEAERILQSLHYPQEKIDQVKHCVLAHRGSQSIQRETIEAECVASADAMAHFDIVPYFFQFAFAYKKLSAEEGILWVKTKLDRAWNKMIPEAQALTQPKRDAFLLLVS